MMKGRSQSHTGEGHEGNEGKGGKEQSRGSGEEMKSSWNLLFCELRVVAAVIAGSQKKMRASTFCVFQHSVWSEV